MNISGLLNQPCILTHREPTDDIDDFGDFIDAVTYTETVCWMYQGTGLGRGEQDESVDVGNLSAETWTYFFPEATTVSERDSVTTGPDSVMSLLVAKVKNGTLTADDLAEAEGLDTREVYGRPWRALNPRTRKYEFVQATCKRAG